MKKIKVFAAGAAILTLVPSTALAAETSKGVALTEEVSNYNIDIPDEVTPFTKTTVDVGGGKWKYGTSLTATLKKKVYSESQHSSKRSKATSIIDGSSNIGTAPVGSWAKSSIIGNRNSTGFTYYEFW